MKKKYIVPLLVVFAFLILPGNILSGNDERNYYYDLGVSYYDEGKISEAISAWEKAIIVSPKFVEAHYNLGNAYEEQGLLKKAILAWENVIAITPFDSDTYFNIDSISTANSAVSCSDTSILESSAIFSMSSFRWSRRSAR